MKLIVIGNTSLISSAALEQHAHSVELIVNTYQRWAHWHCVGISTELAQQQPDLDQCEAFDFFPVREDGEEVLGERATIVIVAESAADKELFDSCTRYSLPDKDQLVVTWLKYELDFPVVQLASFKNEQVNQTSILKALHEEAVIKAKNVLTSARTSKEIADAQIELAAAEKLKSIFLEIKKIAARNF